jgi:hypothetical protein
MRFKPHIRFCFTATDYSCAGLDFYGIDLYRSHLSVDISIDPTTLDESYENHGLVEGIHMELLRHCDP